MNKELEWLKEFGEQSRMGLPDDVYYEYVEKLAFLEQTLTTPTADENVKYWYSCGYYCFQCGCTSNKKYKQFSSKKYNYCPLCGKKLNFPDDKEIVRIEGNG